MRIPLATYRLQLTPQFGFEAARVIVPYLERLGITDLYLSPILEARAGSEHGYDVTDPTRIRDELGGEAAFLALAAAVRERGMGILLDIVPNHMAASHENPWWQDVLTHGRRSKGAGFFDIDWDRAGAGGRIVLPVLGKPLNEAIRAGEINVEHRPEGFAVSYFDQWFPLDPATLDEEALREVNAPAGADGRRPRLEALLERQAYRLVHWIEAAEAVNYRRFFSISDLVGVRVEDPQVFSETHALIARLVSEGAVTGLRVDHVDGLRDPAAYLARLQELFADPLYVVVEKILAPGEDLPAGWPVAGTSGYDFLAAANRLFVDPAGFAKLEEHTAAVTGRRPVFERLAVRKKRELATRQVAGDLRALACRLDASPELQAKVEAALIELTAYLPVYRTYIRDLPATPDDRRMIEIALADARVGPVDLPGRAFDRLHETLLENPDPAARDWTARWQQLSGAIMAKGVEDTAFYLYNPLISLNEVGGDPAAGGLTAAEFHSWIEARSRAWPGALDATSTHDTKRSEDVRARIDVLSEMADPWIRATDRWQRWNAPFRTVVNREEAPSASRELSLYQTLTGVWPLDSAEASALGERIAEYLTKAVREAKAHSSWRAPEEEYEEAVVGFAERLLESGRGGDRPFLPDFHALQEEVAFHGMLNGLAQLVLKLAAPGVADFYQGSELWDLHLVDPDNRRPVDYETRDRWLADFEERDTGALLPALRTGWRDGRLKLWVARRALAFRRSQPELFRAGGYRPLEPDGPGAERLLAFLRRAEEAAGEAAGDAAGDASKDSWLIAILPIRTVGLTRAGEFPLGSSWPGTTIPLPEGAPDRWTDVLTGRTVAVVGSGAGAFLRVDEVLEDLPAAVLHASARTTARVSSIS